MADKKLIRILKNIAILLEVSGENHFKTRAYKNAAQILTEENINLPEEIKNGTLGNIPGFGKALTSKITDYFANSGTMEYYENLKNKIPESLTEITKLPGIGVKKVKQMYEQLHITSIEELENACINDTLSNTKGFGAATQEKCLNNIQHLKASRGRYRSQEAMDEAEILLNFLRDQDNIITADLVSDIRRFTETVSEIVILLAAKDNEQTASELATKFETEHKDNIIRSQTSQGMPITIIVTTPAEYFIKLHNLTGTTEYISAMNDLLRKKQITLDSDSLLKSNTRIEIKSEQDIFHAAGIQFIPPELREDKSAVEAAINNNIPELVKDSDLKGMVHCHSTWSDGRNSIKEMALKSKELGFEYFVICDHSRAAAYAGGLTIDQVKAQHEEIDKLNEENLGIQIVKGIESDILSDGSLDYPDEVLESFDIIVASIHSEFTMKKEEMTARIIKALKNPYTDILGHPSGRLLLARPAYELDIKAIIDCAADYGKIIEINSNPYRLDLPWQDAIYAKQKSLKLAINPDSHRTSTLSDVFTGVKAARKAWLTKDDIINCLDYEQFVKEIVNR